MTPATGVPLRPLVALAAVVLVLHALALRWAPAPQAWRMSAERPVALVRPVVLHAPAAAPDAAEAPPATSLAAPAPVPSAAPKPPIARARPAPAASTAPSTPATAPVSSAAQPPLALALPPPATWHYAVTAQVRGAPASGEALLQWRHDATSYEAQLAIAVPPLPRRLQRSVGALGEQGLAPQRFSDRVRSEEATHFDREQGRLVFSSNRPAAVLQPGAQDRVSVLLQLAALVAGEPARWQAGTGIELQTAGTRDVDDWRFTVDGPEVLRLPAGTVESIKLTRLPRREWDLKLEVWLAPAVDYYAPVRLRLTPPNGDWLDLQWSGTDKG
jgi:hypothetical protein